MQKSIVLSAQFVSEAVLRTKCSSDCKLSGGMPDFCWGRARFEKNWEKGLHDDQNVWKNDSW